MNDESDETVVTGEPLPVRQPSSDAAHSEASFTVDEGESDLRYLRVTDLVGVFYWRTEGGVYDANDTFLSLVGYTRDDLTGGRIDWVAMTPPEYRDQDARALEVLQATGVGPRQEKEFIRKDGTRVPVLIGGVALDAARTHGFAFVIDLTERRRADRALADSERRFRATFEQAAVGMAHVAPDGKWLRVNQRLCEILGYTREELLRLSFQDITHPDDLDNDLELVRRTLAGDIDRYQMEKRYIRKDGSFLWVWLTVSLVKDEWSGEPLLFVSVVEDIDARKRAETALVESEARLARKAALIDLASDAILVQDPDTNRVILWSRGAEALYGWSRDEATGRVTSELLHTAFPEGMDRETVLAALLRDGKWEGDLAQTARDGRRVVVASRWALQRDTHSGEPLAVLEVNRDVSVERKREAAQREEAAQQRRIAEILQHSLLSAPPPDAFPGITVKPLYQPAYADALIGGDFFDIHAVAENKIALVVGDATGKGIEAATYTAEVKFAFRVLLREYPSPAAALERLNNLILEKERLDPLYRGGSYVALVCAVVDTSTGEIACVAAGAEPPFLLRAATGEAVILSDAGGPLLGIAEQLDYAVQKITMEPGDILALTTDGITEARHPTRRNEFFGYDGLVRGVWEESRRTPSLAGVGNTVVERVRAFAGGEIHDDICLLLARRSHP